MSSQAAIKIEGLWKRYGLQFPTPLQNKLDAIKSRRKNGIPIWALQNIDLQVFPGETLGVVGRNGAGKSTLLKVLAGVTPPTKGKVSLYGSVFPMIELNAGLHRELNGRENVRLLASIMGIPRAELASIIDKIEEFCELGKWFEQPVRKYSTGMLARLGFAVAMNVNADILLIDEVLAVGDIAFQRKCFDEIDKLHNSGKAIIFVSHALRQVERLCDRIILLNEGKQIAVGKPASVLSEYYENANLKILEQRFSSGEKIRVLQHQEENSPIKIQDIRFLNAKGEEANSFLTGEQVTLEVSYDAIDSFENPIIGFGIATVDSFYVSGFTNESSEKQIILNGKGSFRCTIKSLPLLTGIYTVQMKIKHPNSGVLGGGYGLAAFRVEVPEKIRLSNNYGIVNIETSWEDN